MPIATVRRNRYFVGVILVIRTDTPEGGKLHRTDIVVDGTPGLDRDIDWGHFDTSPLSRADDDWTNLMEHVCAIAGGPYRHPAKEFKYDPDKVGYYVSMIYPIYLSKRLQTLLRRLQQLEYSLCYDQDDLNKSLSRVLALSGRPRRHKKARFDMCELLVSFAEEVAKIRATIPALIPNGESEIDVLRNARPQLKSKAKSKK